MTAFILFCSMMLWNSGGQIPILLDAMFTEVSVLILTFDPVWKLGDSGQCACPLHRRKSRSGVRLSLLHFVRYFTEFPYETKVEYQPRSLPQYLKIISFVSICLLRDESTDNKRTPSAGKHLLLWSILTDFVSMFHGGIHVSPTSQYLLEYLCSQYVPLPKRKLQAHTKPDSVQK
ncbi:hypothetical protein BJ742DRAFT_321444 [Cladochytrium replicatum]|nr:hypothetical protein BJ742DRAFT_321444 [Cladochytrium replicatum]